MSALCCNCDTNPADVRCRQCKVEESGYCSECWSIHVRIKSCRLHQSDTITSKSYRDSSGKQSRPLFEPSNNAHQDSFKKKLIKNFRFLIDGVSFARVYAAQELEELLESKYDTFQSFTENTNWMFASACVTLYVVIHITAKLLFGKRAIYIFMLLAFGVLRFIKAKQNNYSNSIRKMSQVYIYMY